MRSPGFAAIVGHTRFTVVLGRSEDGHQRRCDRLIYNKALRKAEALSRVAFADPQILGVGRTEAVHSPNLALTRLSPTHLPWADLIHRRQDQIPSTVNPVLQPWVFIDNEVLGAFLERH